MKNKTRFIPLVIIGAILLSLLAVIPAFSAQGNTAFIDPNDTDETLDWTRQGGTFMVEVDDDDLDVPVKHVLFPAGVGQDLRNLGAMVSISANSDMVTRTDSMTRAFSGVTDGDSILVSGQTVREVEEVIAPVADDASTSDNESAPAMIKVNVPFSESSARPLTIARVQASDAMYDECPTCAEVEKVEQSADRIVGTSFILDNTPIADSGVGTLTDRLTGNTNTIVDRSDVLVLATNAISIPLTVFNVLENGTVQLARSPDPTVDLYVAYWGSVRNDTGAAVQLESSSDPSGIPAVLKETGPNTGVFQLTVKAVPETENSNASADPPELRVGASDTIRLLYKDADPSRTDRSTLSVESTDPAFAALGPDNGTRGKESRPDITTEVTDSNSGVDEDSIRVVFARAAAGATQIDSSEERTPVDDGRSRDLSSGSGYRITQSASSNLVSSDDATVYWWVVATDTAGNLAVLDRQENKDFLDLGANADGNQMMKEISKATAEEKDMYDEESFPDPCNSDAFIEDFGSGGTIVIQGDVAISAEIYGCQPYSYSIDFSEPELTGVVTGSFWDASSDDDDKTVTDPADADNTSIRVDFNEDLDADSVQASDFLVKMDDDDDGDRPNDAQVYVGNGDSVFLTVDALDPDAQPIVEVVDEIMDIAGNSLESADENAIDGIAPSIEVTVAGTGSEGGRPVTDEEIVISISVNEAIAPPMVTIYDVDQTGVKTDDDSDSDEGLAVNSRGAAKSATLKSEGHYEFKFKSSRDGLFSVYVTAKDATEQNEGAKGDKVLPLSLDDDTSALLFEVDTKVAEPMITPEETDNPSPFITLDYSGEGEEYAVSDDEVTEDLDSHGKVTIMSATFNGEDITDALVTSDMVKYLYKASDLGSGEYKVEVTAKDEAGNELESEGMVEIAERKPYSVALAPGWNLVSIPGEPADGDINSVIPADHPARSVLSYDPSIPGAWLTATRSNGAFEGTLTEITSGRAYWIHTTSFESIKVDIPRLDAGSPVAPPTINIVKGWNMVPVQDVDEDREDVSAKSYFSGLDVSRVYWFDTVGNTWTSIDVGSVDNDDNATDMLQVGKGYWVFTTEEGTLAP